MTNAALLGLLQGVLEWLPISSEGVLTVVYSQTNDASLIESVQYALWLHVGTMASATVAFRKDVVGLIKELTTRIRRPTPLLSYLILTTALSAVVGVPLLIALEEVSVRLGGVTMGLVGSMMIVTGALQFFRGKTNMRGRDDLTKIDGVLAGLAQGIAVIPGLSRSGLTVAALLLRGLDRREALFLSFLMSIPASLGVSFLTGLDSDFYITKEMLIGASLAFITGLASIRVLMAIAVKINFSVFMIVVGIAIISGAFWDVLM